MASINKRNGKWQVKWRDPGGEQRARTCPDKRTAERLAREVEQTVSLGRSWEVEKPPDVPALTGEGGIVEKFLLDRARSRAPGTMKLLMTRLGMFSDWLAEREGEIPRPDVLTRALLAEYYSHLQVTPGAQGPRRLNTIRDHIEAIQQCWKWAHEHDEDWPGVVPRPRKLEDMPEDPPRLTVAPTWEEMDRCIGELRVGWVRRAAILMRFTGLRINQALRLRWEDIDLDGATLTIRPELGKSKVEKRGRIIPLSLHLVEILSGWGVREGDLVPRVVSAIRERRRSLGLPSREPDAPPATGATVTMSRAWERAGVRPVIWEHRPDHAFRRGLQTGLKRLGVDPDAIEYYVGHSLGAVRDVYLDPDSLPMRALADAILPLSESATRVPLAFPNARPSHRGIRKELQSA